MRLAALLIACCLVLAGCSAPTAGGPTATQPAASDTTDPGTDATPATAANETGSTTSDTETETGPRTLARNYSITVRNGELPVEYSLVFARVALLTGEPEAVPPETVYVRSNSEMGIGSGGFPPFFRLLGIRVPEDQNRSLTAAAYVRNPESVYVNELILDSSTETESTLAHESVHVIQFRNDRREQLLRGIVEGRRTTDDVQTYRAMIEGTAMYVQTGYWQRYLDTESSPSRNITLAYRNASNGAASFGLAPYRFGQRYVRARANSTADLAQVYADPPRTSEQVIHRLGRDEELPADLSVETETGDGWELDRPSRTRMGELFIRVSLGTELSESRAAAGADGWGNDVRIAFDRDGVRGFAWTLRWDDPANATEFTGAFRDWLVSRDDVDRTTTAIDGDETTIWESDRGVYRIQRVSDETVVVFLGDETFVESATASGTDSEVTVRVS